MDKEEDINDLLAKHFSGEITAEEEVIILRWVENNAEEYHLLKSFFVENELLNFPELQLFETDKGWERIVTNIANISKVKPSVFQRYKKYLNIVGGAAAILILSCSLLFFYANQEITVSTADGQIKNVQLSDGSLVTLNERSSISYKRFLWGVRNVKLQGEAFFEVKHDRGRPFSITTGELLVSVLGTSFGVITTEKEKLVAVVTGKVSVESIASKEKVLLEKNQEVYYKAADRLIKNDRKDQNLFSWKTKRLSFKNIPLLKVFRDIEKCYHVKIDVEGKMLESCSITTNFENESLKEVLEELHLLYGFDYAQKGNIIRIKNISCEQ